MFIEAQVDDSDCCLRGKYYVSTFTVVDVNNEDKGDALLVSLSSERTRYPLLDSIQVRKIPLVNQYIISDELVFQVQDDAIKYYNNLEPKILERDVIYSKIDLGIMGGNSLQNTEYGNLDQVNMVP